jgi:hypothetical protein
MRHVYSPCRPARPQGLLARLDAKRDRSGGPDACWPFTGARSRGQWRETDYGCLREGPKGSKRWRVHRLVLLLDALPKGAFRDEHTLLHWLHLADAHYAGYEAAHQCDHSLCGNPAHLKWESHTENVERAAARRQQVEA